MDTTSASTSRFERRAGESARRVLAGILVEEGLPLEAASKLIALASLPGRLPADPADWLPEDDDDEPFTDPTDWLPEDEPFAGGDER